MAFLTAPTITLLAWTVTKAVVALWLQVHTLHSALPLSLFRKCSRKVCGYKKGLRIFGRYFCESFVMLHSWLDTHFICIIQKCSDRLLQVQLYIGNLSPEWQQDEAFEKAMATYGPLERVFIVKNAEGHSKVDSCLSRDVKISEMGANLWYFVRF